MGDSYPPTKQCGTRRSITNRNRNSDHVRFLSHAVVNPHHQRPFNVCTRWNDTNRSPCKVTGFKHSLRVSKTPFDKFQHVFQPLADRSRYVQPQCSPFQVVKHLKVTTRLRGLDDTEGE